MTTEAIYLTLNHDNIKRIIGVSLEYDDIDGAVNVLLDNDLVLSFQTDGTIKKYAPVLSNRRGLRTTSKGFIKMVPNTY